MADSKVTALTALTALTGDETFYIVEDDDGTPVSRKVTVEDLATGLRHFLSGALLASVSYDPGTLGSYAVTSATLVDVDATNLAATFIAPASGNVMVDLIGVQTCAADCALAWGLREGSSIISGYHRVNTVPSGEGDRQLRAMTSVKITGLTPGASYTYKWAHARTTGSGSVSTFAGGVTGAAVMRVWSA